MPLFAWTALELVTAPVDDKILYLMAAGVAVMALAAALYVASVLLAAACWCWRLARDAGRVVRRLRSLAREAPAADYPGLTSGG